MSLIDEVAKLRALEQKAIGGAWEDGKIETGCIAGDDGRGMVVLRKTNDGDVPSQENIDFICEARNLAPAMLRVLECFREGDAERLERAAERLRVEAIGWREEDFRAAKEDIAAYRRLRAAAALMEQEGRS